MSVARGSESRWRQLRLKDSQLPNVEWRISLAGEGGRELDMEPYCVGVYVCQTGGEGTAVYRDLGC